MKFIWAVFQPCCQLFSIVQHVDKVISNLKGWSQKSLSHNEPLIVLLLFVLVYKELANIQVNVKENNVKMC